jgi:hypothetical protein
LPAKFKRLIDAIKPKPTRPAQKHIIPGKPGMMVVSILLAP